MKIKLYSARKLDKKFPSGKWNGIEIIGRHNTNKKYWWNYFGIPHKYYKKLTRTYHKVINVDDEGPCTKYKISDGTIIPEIFVKKVKQ